MEDTLRVLRKFIIANGLKVLILVVMEDTLRVLSYETAHLRFSVLILVVMEDTLRVVSTGREMTVRRVS